MGLRELKKERARIRIIENAIALFRERGFEAATVREVCVRCDISEATFFNYFPTKSSVLSAWAHGLVEEAFRTACPEPASATERGLRPVLRSLCTHLAQEVEADSDFASRAWVRAVIPGHAPASAEGIVRIGQESGQLRRDLSARQMGGILYGSVCGTVAEWLARDVPRGALASELRRAVDLVLDGSRRRNERVRPTRGVTAAPPG